MYDEKYRLLWLDTDAWSRRACSGALKGKADFVSFVHNQTRELIQRYQPDILWFDGFWLDPLWSAREGRHLYQVIKSAKSDVLSTRLSVTKDSTGQETFWTDGASGDYFSMEAKRRMLLISRGRLARALRIRYMPMSWMQKCFPERR